MKRDTKLVIVLFATFQIAFFPTHQFSPLPNLDKPEPKKFWSQKLQVTQMNP